MSKLTRDKAANHPYIRLLKALKRQQDAREHLRHFIPLVFETVSPSDIFLPNWHIDAMSEYLMACYRRDIKRLIINIPPRYMKSISVAVAFPAWAMGQNPSLRFMAASYAQDLAYQHSDDCRMVMQSDWYKAMFPGTQVYEGKTAVKEFFTTKRGRRIATSVGGGSTGKGGDFLIVDDPHNPKQAESDIQRDAAIRWFGKTFASRLNDKKQGVIIVVMQRLHDNDLSGHLLKGEEWEHLKLPAECPVAVTVQIGNWKYERKEGEVLHPAREGQAELDALKKNSSMGPMEFEGQYNQDPVSREGAIIKRHWAKRWKVLPAQVKRLIHVWDTGYKEKQSNSFSALTIWQETDTGYYLREAWRGRPPYPDLKREIKMAYARDNKPGQPVTIVMEEKASGISLIQDLRSDKIPVVAVPAEQDKVLRCTLTTPIWESGLVWLPDESLGFPWQHDYENEIFKFPRSQFNDWADSTAHALNYFHSLSGSLDDFESIGSLETA